VIEPTVDRRRSCPGRYAVQPGVAFRADGKRRTRPTTVYPVRGRFFLLLLSRRSLRGRTPRRPNERSPETTLTAYRVCSQVRLVVTSLSVCGTGYDRKEVTFINIAWLPKATVQVTYRLLSASDPSRRRYRIPNVTFAMIRTTRCDVNERTCFNV